MYTPNHFDETRIEVMHALIRAHPLATLVTLGSGGIVANHIPIHLSETPMPFGTLQGHVARSNSVWRDYSRDVEALAVFQGPESYITPSWYATKKETGKVVPTWNYAVVHAYGSLRMIEDAAWLRLQLEKLTADNESRRPEPWQVSDAPIEYTEKLIGAPSSGLSLSSQGFPGNGKRARINPPRIGQASYVAWKNWAHRMR